MPSEQAFSLSTLISDQQLCFGPAWGTSTYDYCSTLKASHSYGAPVVPLTWSQDLAMPDHLHLVTEVPQSPFLGLHTPPCRFA